MMDEKALTGIVVSICNDILLNNKENDLPILDLEGWEKLFRLASEQGLLPIITQGLERLEPEDKRIQRVLSKSCGNALKNRRSYLHRISLMREMSRWFGEEGIDIMFIKGASLSQLYPVPEHRVFSDIDFYLFGNFQKGISVMEQHGIKNSPFYHHHTQASIQGVLLENHYDFVERVNHKCDVLIDDSLKNLASKEGRSLRAWFLGEEVRNAYLMTPTMNAIFLMRHMSAHFTGETISLRMLYDWSLFVKKQGQEVDWDYVKNLYLDSGMMRFAGIVKGLMSRYFNYDSAYFPVVSGKKDDIEKVWDSIFTPPPKDPYKKYTLRYYLFETKIFFANRWKHEIVYPGETYLVLFFRYVNLAIRMIIRRR